MKQKIRNAIVVSIPLVLVLVAIGYAPGVNAKMLTGWGFVLGVFTGALGESMLTSKKAG